VTHPHPAPLASLGDAVIGVEWGSDRSKAIIEKKGKMYMRLAGDGKEIEGGVMAHSLRSIGSVSEPLDITWKRSSPSILIRADSRKRPSQLCRAQLLVRRRRSARPVL